MSVRNVRAALRALRIGHAKHDSVGVIGHACLQEEHARLQKKFNDVQRGFMMGELQDDVRESLMADVASTARDGSRRQAAGAGRDSAVVEEQSAMQKLIEQLKDAKEAMLNSHDDIKYWKVRWCQGAKAQRCLCTSAEW